MGKWIVGVSALGSALMAAAPASAQYYPRAYGYDYGANPYSSIEARIQNVIGSINSAPYYEQNQLRAEAFGLERRVRYAAQRGVDPWQLIGNRLEQLELQVNEAVHSGRYEDHRVYGFRGERYGRHHNDDRDDRDD